MTPQKLLYLMKYYVSKQVFSWRAKNAYIWCINTWKSWFSHDVTENKVDIWCIITFRSRFSHDAPKTLIFDVLLRDKAGFLMTSQKGANLLHYNVEKEGFLKTCQRGANLLLITWKSRFSHYATENDVYIWCIITFRSRFSHDASKSLVFYTLLHGKAGFLMTRQTRANLLHYYVSKQVFSWRNRKQCVHLMQYYVS